MSNGERQFRLAEIEVNRSPMEEKIVGMFRYESDARGKGGGKRGPVLVILAEIASTLYVYEQLLEVLNATAEQTRPLISAVDTDPMARFEKLIQKLNEAVAAFLTKEPTPVVWNRVNIFVIELSDQHLCLCGLGRLTNVFLQKQQDGGWRAFDLFGSLEQPAEVDPKKPFASLICGDIHPGDVLFAGSQNFERLRQELQINDRLKSLPPVTAALEIRQDLERRAIPDDFAGMVIASVELPATIEVEGAKAPIDDRPKSTQSVEKLQAEVKKTQAMLSPTVNPLGRPGEPSAGLAERAKQLAASGLSKAKAWLPTATAEKDPLAMASLRGMSAGHGSFLTAKRKLLIGAAVGIVILAVAGTLWYREAKRFAEEQRAWNLSFDQALDKKSRAEADLVIGNEDRAQRTLTEAREILSRLDDDTNDRKQAKQQLTKDLDELAVKLRREVVVADPMELASLSLNTAENALVGAAFLKDRIYAADASGQALVSVLLSTREVKRQDLPANAGTPERVVAADTKLLVWTDQGKLLSVDPARNSVTSLRLTTHKASSTRALAFYNKRLYTLDPAGNMIWRFGSTSGGYSNETAYLKQNTHNLAEATDLAIDSSVYVSFGNGSVTRYLLGAEETWGLSAVDPPLTSASAIWTHADSDRIAIADRSGKRVLVFRKDGKLVAQIRSDTFTGPRFVTGDEKQRKLYVVDGNRLFQLDLP